MPQAARANTRVAAPYKITTEHVTKKSCIEFDDTVPRGNAYWDSIESQCILEIPGNELTEQECMLASQELGMDGSPNAHFQSYIWDDTNKVCLYDYSGSTSTPHPCFDIIYGDDGSSTVLINNQKAHRKGDDSTEHIYTTDGDGNCNVTHIVPLAEGSPDVFVNNKALGREDDKYSDDMSLNHGATSATVHVNSKGGKGACGSESISGQPKTTAHFPCASDSCDLTGFTDYFPRKARGKKIKKFLKKLDSLVNWQDPIDFMNHKYFSDTINSEFNHHNAPKNHKHWIELSPFYEADASLINQELTGRTRPEPVTNRMFRHIINTDRSGFISNIYYIWMGSHQKLLKEVKDVLEKELIENCDIDEMLDIIDLLIDQRGGKKHDVVLLPEHTAEDRQESYGIHANTIATIRHGQQEIMLDNGIYDIKIVDTKTQATIWEERDTFIQLSDPAGSNIRATCNGNVWTYYDAGLTVCQNNGGTITKIEAAAPFDNMHTFTSDWPITGTYHNRYTHIIQWRNPDIPSIKQNVDNTSNAIINSAGSVAIVITIPKGYNYAEIHTAANGDISFTPKTSTGIEVQTLLGFGEAIGGDAYERVENLAARLLNVPESRCSNPTIYDEASCLAALDTWIPATDRRFINDLYNMTTGQSYINDTSITPTLNTLTADNKIPDLGALLGSWYPDLDITTLAHIHPAGVLQTLIHEVGGHRVHNSEWGHGTNKIFTNDEMMNIIFHLRDYYVESTVYRDPDILKQNPHGCAVGGGNLITDVCLAKHVCINTTANPPVTDYSLLTKNTCEAAGAGYYWTILADPQPSTDSSQHLTKSACESAGYGYRWTRTGSWTGFVQPMEKFNYCMDYTTKARIVTATTMDECYNITDPNITPQWMTGCEDYYGQCSDQYTHAGITKAECEIGGDTWTPVAGGNTWFDGVNASNQKIRNDNPEVLYTLSIMIELYMRWPFTGQDGSCMNPASGNFNQAPDEEYCVSKGGVWDPDGWWPAFTMDGSRTLNKFGQESETPYGNLTKFNHGIARLMSYTTGDFQKGVDIFEDEFMARIISLILVNKCYTFTGDIYPQLNSTGIKLSYAKCKSIDAEIFSKLLKGKLTKRKIPTEKEIKQRLPNVTFLL